MKATYALAAAILKINSTRAIQAAIFYLMQVFMLDPSDPYGLRHGLPSLLLRVGDFQKSYGFSKGFIVFNTPLPNIRYMSANYLENENILKRLGAVVKYRSPVGHFTALMLLKIRLLCTIQELVSSSALLRLSRYLPLEFIHMVKFHLIEAVTNGHSAARVLPNNIIKDLKVQIALIHRGLVSKDRLLGRRWIWDALIEASQYFA